MEHGVITMPYAGGLWFILTATYSKALLTILEAGTHFFTLLIFSVLGEMVHTVTKLLNKQAVSPMDELVSSHHFETTKFNKN